MRLKNLLAIVLFSTTFIFCAQDNNSDSQNETEQEKHSVNTISGISVKDMEGNSIKLSDYEGKVLLIVNVASKCGFTPQYEGLQTLYDTYKSQGFEILAFPCNDFKGQEPGTNDEILDFCSSNYGVTFKLFDKIKVLGEDKEPLYKLLTTSTAVETGDIGWNFEKFLISKDGEILKRFGSSTEPLSAEILKAVESALKS